MASARKKLERKEKNFVLVFSMMVIIMMMIMMMMATVRRVLVVVKVRMTRRELMAAEIGWVG